MKDVRCRRDKSRANRVILRDFSPPPCDPASFFSLHFDFCLPMWCGPHEIMPRSVFYERACPAAPHHRFRTFSHPPREKLALRPRCPSLSPPDPLHSHTQAPWGIMTSPTTQLLISPPSVVFSSSRRVFDVRPGISGGLEGQTRVHA
jgi:hypothetical protein